MKRISLVQLAENPLKITQTEADSDVGPKEQLGSLSPRVDPMPWAFTLWSLSILGSLVLSRALAPALRGAFVGKERWIAIVDLTGARLSQAAAIATMLLLVHFGLSSIRVAQSKLLALGAALLGSIPAMILMLAQKQVLPHAHSWSATLCAALVLLLCSKIGAKQGVLNWISGLGGTALLCTALSAVDFRFGPGSRLLALLWTVESASTWSMALLLVFHQIWRTRTRPWMMPSLLAFAFLLSTCAQAAGRADSTPGLLLIGRSVFELSPYATLGSAAPFALCTVFSCALVNAFARRSSLEHLVSSLLALGILVPASPLVVAWLTVCGFFVVVLGESNGSALLSRRNVGNAPFPSIHAAAADNH